jgi:CBS domain-containing protein
VTDFILDQPVTITKDRPIDEALQQMIRAGVRSMLVVQAEIVTGLITSYDIEGERPLQFLRTSSYARHDEIEVGHIMTPWVWVPTLEWEVVRTARVADVERLFKRTSTTHLLLIKTSLQGRIVVRGLISRTRLERQLGHSVEH